MADAALVGKVATYDLTVGIMLDIENMIHLISPFDVPLLGQNGADGKSVLSSDTCFEKKVEWLDEELLTPVSALAATCVTADGYITVTTTQRTRFSTGDIITIDNERMRVTGLGTTADTLTVTRGGTFGTSTAAQHSNLSVVVGIGQALAEGADPENPRTLDRVNRFNITQIFGPTAVQVTGSENVVKKYGLVMSEFDYQVANRAKEQLIHLEQALMYGERVEDSTNRWRTMGGLNYYITTNVDSTTTQITESKILDQLQICYAAGGNPDRLLVGPQQKRNVSALATGLTVYTGRPDEGRGTIVNSYESDFGQISIVLSRWVRKADAFLFNRDQATVTTLRPMAFEMLAKTGDAMKGQIVQEKSFKLRRQQHAAKFTALT